MTKNPLLSYEQVCLLPKCGIVGSRSSCDTSYFDSVTGTLFKVPVMPANMKCCIDTSKAKWMSENGYFYSMHRFGDNYEFVRTANEEGWKFISVSVGVKESDTDFIDWIVENNMRVDCITIDIAHGHSYSMRLMIEYIKSRYFCLLVAGNVCTPQACHDLKSWGADMIKVGIAQGGACTTYGKTGFGTPMFSTVLECSQATDIPIIADGGIKTNGDISKALAAGAKMVMAGSLFASCIDSPAESIYDNSWMEHAPYGGLLSNSDEYIQGLKVKYGKVVKKVYFGSASKFNKGGDRHIEGKLIQLECNEMTYEQKLTEIQDDIQSAISYSGGLNLEKITSTEWRQIL